MREMGVGERGLGNDVRRDVVVVDHPPALEDLFGEVFREELVAYSWLAESVELVDMAEKVFDFKGSESGKGRPQTEPSHIDLGPTIEGKQLLDVDPKLSSNARPGSIEPLMHQTVITAPVLDLSQPFLTCARSTSTK